MDLSQITFLTRGDIDLIHADQLAKYGGQEGVLDENGVEAALNAPKHWAYYASYDPEDLIPGLAAAYLVSYATRQYFVDGNKRVGTAASNVFLQANGYELACEDEELYPVAISVAINEKSHEDLIDFIREHLQAVEDQDDDHARDDDDDDDFDDEG